MTPTHATREGTKRYRYYVCTSAQQRGRHTCPSRSIPASEIERFVVQQIASIGRDPQLVAETIRQVHSQAKQRMEELAAEERRLQRELTSHHRDLQILVRCPAIGQNKGLEAARFADLQERVASAERRLTEVCGEAEHLRHDLIDEIEASQALAEFSPVWESLTPREQGRMLQLLIERIDYDGEDSTISITFHPSGIRTLANHRIQEDAA